MSELSKRKMIAVIPAAGRGTRMGEFTNELPKPMLPLWGKPVIGHILSQIARSGVEKTILIVGYRQDAIRSYIGNGKAFGLEVEYVVQEKPLGTAHAITLAKQHICSHWHFLVQFADIIVPARWYKKLFSVDRREWDGVITLDKTDYSLGAAVQRERNGRVLRIVEKPPMGSINTAWNNAGIMLLSTRVLDSLPSPSSSAFETEKGEIAFPSVVDKWITLWKTNVKGLAIPPSWYFDIKDRAAYEKLGALNMPRFLR